MRAIRHETWFVRSKQTHDRLAHLPLGWVIPDWPKLLHLYSRFRAGKTVRDWMEEYDVHKLGIDVRRFTSFGVIKVRVPLSALPIGILSSHASHTGVPTQSPPLAHPPHPSRATPRPAHGHGLSRSQARQELRLHHDRPNCARLAAHPH